MTSTTTTHAADKQTKTGRKRRQRKGKAQEIARIAAAFATNTATSEQRLIPTDRGTTFPAARALRDLTPQDEISLVQQLGYLPGNVIHIATRMRDLPEALREDDADHDAPVVVQLYPIALRQRSDGSRRKRKRGGKQGANTVVASTATAEDTEQSEDLTTATNSTAKVGDDSSVVTEPFPTSYWLTHPGLHTAVSQLELERFVHAYEQRLAGTPDAAAAMERAHRAYGSERWDLISNDTTTDWPFPANALDATRGIAGNRNFHTVKCLHAHTAHVLSGGAGAEENVVGQWVLDELVARRTVKQQAKVTNTR